MSQISTLDAHVAQIIDQYQIALNVGSDHRVQDGDVVTLWRTVTVKDPITKESLGDTRLPKLRLRVNQVHPRFCLARVTDHVGRDSGALSAFLTSPLVRIVQGESSHSGSGETAHVKVGEAATVAITFESTGSTEQPPF